MKKLIVILLLIVTMFGLIPTKTHATSTGYFVVTAYYSPLPNQSAYIMGSYEAELRMNGMGIRGASGKKVFPGMLAAPQSYSFGTKIYLAGLGVGEVADRGGAIVAKGQRGFKHDRIDVWMGHGEEGLRRAMYWGNRTVKGYITKRNYASTINLKNHPAPVWATAGLKKVSNIYNIGIGLHSPKSTVIKLQELLKNTGYYHGELDGDYNSIMSIVYKFQLENGLVINENTFGAAYWGKLTRALFLKKYLNGTLNPPKKTEGVAQITPKVEIENTATEIADEVEEVATEEKVVEDIPKEIDVFAQALTTEAEFTKLQKILTEIGLYNGDIDGKYASIRDLILEYQIGKLLVDNEGSIGAGIYGPKTRATLQKDYDDFLRERQELEEGKKQMAQRKLELEQKFKELEKLAEEDAEGKVAHIGLLKHGDVSPAVRDLQNIMKELGYFDHKDTAIYGDMTEESIFNYQVDRGLLSSKTDIGAGICGPVTKGQIKKDLKTSHLESLLFENKLSPEELTEHGITTF